VCSKVYFIFDMGVVREELVTVYDQCDDGSCSSYSVQEPLASIIDILQGEKHVFFGMLFPGLVALRRKIQILKEKSWLYCAPLVEIYSSCKSMYSVERGERERDDTCAR